MQKQARPHFANDAWGNITSQTETVGNRLKYAGEIYDEETGLIYLRNRYYDPSTGRFTQEDPARDKLNWYAYCGNNPVNFVDPSGEISISALTGLITYVQSVLYSPDLQYDIDMLVFDLSQEDYISAALGVVDILAPGFSGMKSIPKGIRKYYDEVLDGIINIQRSAIDDIFKDAIYSHRTKGSTLMYKKIGTYEKALTDFNSLKLKNVRTYDNGTIAGELQNGITVNLHGSHKEGDLPTLEIGDKKIRYYKELMLNE